MKVRFVVSASGLPDVGGAYATLSYNDSRFGCTEVISGSANPLWAKMFVLDLNNVREANISVSVLSRNDKREIGCVQFNVAAILERKSGVLYKDLTGGGRIFVHASEYMVQQTAFKFHIHGNDMINVSRAKALGKKPSPLYELRSSSGSLIVHTSEVKEGDLNPQWSAAEVSLMDLCHGDFDALITFFFFHEDSVKKKKPMGSLKTTVNDLVVAAARGKSMLMMKDGERAGRILVLKAECVGFTNSSVLLKKAVEARDLLDAQELVAEAKKKVAVQTKEELAKAFRDAEARRKSEHLAKTALAEAREAAEKAMAESVAAAEVAKQLKESASFGTLKFQFVGRKLKNVETFGLFNIDKSDPFFVLQKAASEKDGQITWSHVYISEVVMDDLEPIWKDTSVEVDELCSGDHNELIRVVVFDWEQNEKHQLIGYYETTINGIISAQRSKAEVPLTNGNEVTGFIFVPYAEVVGLVESLAAEKKAEELAEKAENARFFALGAEHKVKIAGKTTKDAQNAAMQIKQTFDAAAAEANAARKRALDKTVTQRLGELGLGF